MRFNKDIKFGYRINHRDTTKILKSIFTFHNETINIWTHLIGAFIIFSIIIWFFAVVDKAEL